MRLETPRQRRRRRVLEAPFLPAWRSLLTERVAHWCFLGDAERDRLEGLIKVFLVEKEFEGAGGLKVAEDIRVTIAAQACLLVLGLEDGAYYYRDVHSSSCTRPPWSDGAAGLGRAARGDDRGAGGPGGRGPAARPVVIVWDRALLRPGFRAGPQRRVPRVRPQDRHGRWVGRRGAGAPRSGGRRAPSGGAGRGVRSVAGAGRGGIPDLLDSYGATTPWSSLPWPPRRSSTCRCRCSTSTQLYAALAGFYRQEPAARVRRCAGEGARYLGALGRSQPDLPAPPRHRQSP